MSQEISLGVLKPFCSSNNIIFPLEVSNEIIFSKVSLSLNSKVNGTEYL